MRYSEKIKIKENCIFGELIEVLTDYTANGSFESLANNVCVKESIDYAKWVRIQNLDANNFEEKIKYVTKHSYEFLSKSKLSGDELLISKTGEYLGKAYIFKPTKQERYTLADNIFLIRLKNEEYKEFLYTYINSNIGRRLMLRWSQGTGQPTIIKDSLRMLLTPKFTSFFNKKISYLVNESLECGKRSFEEYQNAINILNQNIDIKIEEIDKFNIKKFSDLYLRMDAEYYQHKYDELFDILNCFKTLALGGENGLVSIIKSIEPGSESYVEEGIPFIRVSDIDKFGISNATIKLSKDFIVNIEELYPKKDTILLSKDGSVGIAYKIEEDIESVTSSALLHLTVRDQNIILPDYLTLVLNSPIVQLQAERDCNGAIIQHWKPSDIEKVLIPILDMLIQQKIADKVQESFRLRRASKRLLDVAVKSVEMAIETDEETALKWLENQKV